MKAIRVPLTSWHSDFDTVEVDWPCVQRTVGLDRLQWLLSQDHTQCQLVVDCADSHYTLTAEFYNDAVHQSYLSMWS